MNTHDTLNLCDVTIALHGRALVRDFNADIAPGETLTVMGASGVGKSTLLSFIAGTLDGEFTASGRVLLGDDDLTTLPSERRRIGILFQDDLLFPHLSVGDNLAFALPADVRPRGRRVEAIVAALNEAGLAGFEARDPASLSGGQRARVALLRTLLSRPRALLLDEPFNRLDEALRRDFRSFAFEHARSRALPMLLVTHDEADALAAGGPIVRLDATP